MINIDYYCRCDKIASESSLAFWFEMIDGARLVINDRRSVLFNAAILIKVVTSVIE